MAKKIFLATETHAPTPSSTIAQLSNTVDLFRNLVLFYSKPFSREVPKSSDDKIIHAGQDAWTGLTYPENAIYQLFDGVAGAVELIMTGSYFGSCHLQTFSNVLDVQSHSNISINYHFIHDLLQYVTRSQGLLLESITYFKRLNTIRPANLFSDLVHVDPDTFLSLDSFDSTDSNIFLWSDVNKFKEYAHLTR